eukprot:GHVU01040516.1.p1 GENE.GHVU01040516.1~~GHVU01040516.1.p1  ORF type:complete len:534 (+),score=40.83 GHVU01040516.1:60-1661(+)
MARLYEAKTPAYHSIQFFLRLWKYTMNLVSVIVAMVAFSASPAMSAAIEQYDNNCANEYDAKLLNLMDLIQTYQKNTAGPFHSKTRALPIVSKLARAAYYHVNTHHQPASGETGCDLASTVKHCHDLGNKPLKGTSTTTYRHDGTSTSFQLNETPPSDAKSWVEKVTDFTCAKAEVITVWTDASEFETSESGVGSMKAAFNADCATSACSADNTNKFGNQNKVALAASGSSDMSAMGMYIYGRLAVIYMAKISNFQGSSLVQCRWTDGIPAFNKRCDSASRYVVNGVQTADPGAVNSKLLLTALLKLTVQRNEHIDDSAEMTTAETVGQLAYYRAKVMANTDWCYQNVCAHTQPWTSIKGVHSCLTTNQGPAVSATTTCPGSVAADSFWTGLQDAYKQNLNQNALALGIDNGSSSTAQPACKEWVIAKTEAQGVLTQSDLYRMLGTKVWDDQTFREGRWRAAAARVEGRIGVAVLCSSAPRTTWGGDCPATRFVARTTTSTTTTPTSGSGSGGTSRAILLFSLGAIGLATVAP